MQPPALNLLSVRSACVALPDLLLTACDDPRCVQNHSLLYDSLSASLLFGEQLGL